MSPVWQTRLWVAQRLSAVIMAVCVVIHLGVMIWAVRSGLSAASILGRTQGSVLAALFYATFVFAAAVHAPIGLVRIAEEWVHWRGASLAWAAGLLSAVMTVLGLAAVWGLVR